MKILLTPDAGRSSPLRNVYDQAFKEATELYIASAYLTDWSASKPLGTQCKRLWFFVGTDFGLTRKKAMHDVLRWIPKGGSFLFNAVSQNGLPGGFHPKIMFWKTAAGKHYCVLGSANLSKAAFHHNYEANAFTPITKTEFDNLASWLPKVQTVPITPDWIRHKYKEALFAKLKKLGGPGKVSGHFTFKAGLGYSSHVQKRRQQQIVFRKLATDINSHIQRCGAGKISNGDFWSWFWQTWANKTTDLQGSQQAADHLGSRAEALLRRTNHGRGDVQSVRQSSRWPADLRQFVLGGAVGHTHGPADSTNSAQLQQVSP